MDKPTYDVIVVGVGTMGASVCFNLAQAGLRVLGIEQFAIGHPLGAYTGESRMFRLSYFEHADFVPLLREAKTLWREAESEWGRGEVFAHTGGLYMGAPGSALVSGSLDSARKNDISHELLTHREVRKRYPQFRLPEDFVGFYEPSAGYLRSQRAVEMYVALAMRHGAQFVGHQQVTGWSAGASGVTVTTKDATYQAGQLVLATGAWTTKLVRDLGVKLTVTRQCMGWIQPREFAPFERDRFCCWAVEGPRDEAAGAAEFHYGFPLGSGGPGLKVAEHVVREPADVDSVDRTPNATDEARFRVGIDKYLPGAGAGKSAPLLGMRVCLYTMTPDGFFIVDRHPGHANVLLCCGFSGHGFKFASAIGRVARDFVTEQKTPAGATFLGLGRFT